MKLIKLALMLMVGFQVHGMNQGKKESNPLLPSSPKSHYGLLRPLSQSGKNSIEGELQSDDPTNYSFYANVILPNKEEANNDSLGINTQPAYGETQTNLSFIDDGFRILCIRHLILNGAPLAKKSKRTAINLGDLGLTKSGDIRISLEQCESIYRAKGSIAILEDKDLVNFEPEEMNLAGNQLEELPVELAQLKALRKLSLASNSLRKMPSVIKEFKKLQELDVTDNPLKEICFDDVRGLTELKRIFYSGTTHCAATLVNCGIAKKKE